MSEPGVPRVLDIHFEKEKLESLQVALDRSTLPSKPIVESMENAWSYGSELAKLKQLVEDWKAGSPSNGEINKATRQTRGVEAWWRSVEETMNEHPHFLVDIQGVTLHYQRFTMKHKDERDVIPLIFSHGWPGSFIEARPLAEQLLQRKSPPFFDIIVPSLPGFGLSSQPPREGWTLADTANLFNELMTKVLGFSAYMAQGGDWGSLVTRFLANYKECKLYHTNFMPPRLPIWMKTTMHLQDLGILGTGNMDAPLKLLGYSEQDVLGLKRSLSYRNEGSAYCAIQNTKPATIGYSLYDNPVGILAYFLEKFHAWSDPRCPAFSHRNVDRDSQMNDENILINATLYHLTGTIHTSMLPYRESMKFFTEPKLIDSMTKAGKDKPFGHSAFPYELAYGPKDWLKAYPVRLAFYSRHEKGGHFAALDNPCGLADDVVQFVDMSWPKAK